MHSFLNKRLFYSCVVALTLFFTISFEAMSQEGTAYRKGKIKHRISVGLLKSFYKNQPEYTINTKAKTGYTASYKAELFLGKKTNLLLGLEYFNQGLTFNGYYEAPGHTYVFDKTFAYSHDLSIQEVHLPLSLKVAFNSEREHFYTPYFIGGVGARYIFSSYSVIGNDSTGITVFDQKDNIDFEHQQLVKNLSAFFQVGVGLQKNFRISAKAVFFEISYKQAISRLHYDGNKNSNDLNIKDNHLIFSIGLRL
jgi:hypothetical protein